MKLPSSQTYATWLALLRIYTGAAWIAHGVTKFLHGPQYLTNLPHVVQHAAGATTGAAHDMLLSVVAPNAGAFAEVLRAGEVLVGCSLVFGLWTRLGGFGGVVLAATALIASGTLGTLDAVGSLSSALLALSAVHLLLPTGRALGVDALFARRHPQEAVVIPEFVDETRPTAPTAPAP